MKQMNKKEQTIYCIAFVICLIILAFGDKIALHIIKENPNPNNKVFKGIEKDDINFSFINEITIESIIDKINKKESFYLLFIRKDCYACDKLIEKASSFSADIIYPIYYIDRESVNNELFNMFINSDNRIYENHTLTPLLLKYENGYLMDTLVGIGKNNRLEDFLCKID